jgi:Protein of unknown function (DUF3800)
VYVTYFDEIKPNPKRNQPHYWLGAISLPMAEIAAVENKLNDLAHKQFGSRELTRSTEFHSVDIYFRNGNFKHEQDVGKRLQVFRELFDVFDSCSSIEKTFVKIIPENIKYSSQSPESIAFMYLCEQVDGVMKRLKSHTLLIGDQDEERSNSAVREFLQYRTHGTNWRMGKDLECVIDSLYFTHSHHSRMLQLADVYVFSMRVSWGTDLTGSIFKDLKTAISRKRHR